MSNDRILELSIAVEKTLYAFDMLYTYYANSDIVGLEVGKRVIVPFGRGNKHILGYIFDVKATDTVDPKKKFVEAVLDGEAIPQELITLAAWIKENTFSTFYDAVKVMLPPGNNVLLLEKLTVNEQADTTTLSEAECNFVEELKTAKTNAQREALLEKEKLLVTLLVQKNVLIKSDVVKSKASDSTRQMVRLTANLDEVLIVSDITEKQQLVIDTLLELSSATIKEICAVCGVQSGVINTLIKKGIVEKFLAEKVRLTSQDAVAKMTPGDIVLSEKQAEVFTGMKALLSGGSPACALLYGVTGSGKTSIFVKLIEESLAANKSAIMLVPEISLTPQMVGNFQSIFGNKVAIIHSGLSLLQRSDEYKRIQLGEASIVIGTRSAVFAPLLNIGIIIIDEENDHSYISSKSPRYNAIDVAKQRSFYHKSLLVLASATPSLTSYYYAKSGRYKLFTLSERYSSAILPDVYLVDMKKEAQMGNRSNFSAVLVSEIQMNLNKGEQSMLLLNRRGFYTYINCISCGNVLMCPYCDVPFTYHKDKNTLSCHFCGYTCDMPDKCDKCNSTYLHQSGTGTERLEEELALYFPKARILRMDSDTITAKSSYEDKFTKFRQGEYDIMVGTQMIAKGLDFENVTLVGVLLIDKALYFGDYKGYESTFSLLTQVVGRAGRGAKRGRAFIQTFSPDHHVLTLAAQQNYKEFYEQEIAIRRELIFPPFCDIFAIVFYSEDETVCMEAADTFKSQLKEAIATLTTKPTLIILGPTRAGKFSLKYYYKLILKCKNKKTFRTLINDTIISSNKTKKFTKVGYYVDVNGDSI